MRLVHLSDLHFGAVEPGRPEALRRAVTAANPDLVVVSGDLSQHGTTAELREATAFLATLPQPQLIVPGNHDMPHGLHLWSRFRNTFFGLPKSGESGSAARMAWRQNCRCRTQFRGSRRLVS